MLVAAVTSSLALLTAGRQVAAHAAGVSAIGNEAPISFAVSPIYVRTHMVAAVAVPVGGCSQACVHLWITRDGGARWRRAAAQPPGMDMVVVENASGAESLVVDSQQGLQVSDDDGGTWRRVGSSGKPSTAPSLGRGAVIVAGRGDADYVLAGDATRTVPGSSGAGADLAFALTGAPASSASAFALLATRDRSSGMPVVQHCNASLLCSGAAILPGAHGDSSSGDITLLPAANFSSTGAAVVRTPSTLYATLDGGQTFLSLGLPPHLGAQYTTIPAAALDPRDARTLYVALLEVVATGGTQLTTGGVYVTHDSGTTWRAVGSPGPLDGGATSVATTPDGHLLAGYVDGHGDAGMVCSADGMQWRSSCGDPTATCGSCASSVQRTPLTAAVIAHVAANHGNKSTTSAAAGGVDVPRPPAARAATQRAAGSLLPRGAAIATPVVISVGGFLTARRRWRRSACR